jgi:hypothetical protein
MYTGRLVDLPAVPEWSDFDDRHVSGPRSIASIALRTLGPLSLAERPCRSCGSSKGGGLPDEPRVNRKRRHNTVSKGDFPKAVDIIRHYG